MMEYRAPDADEIAAAFRAGATVRCGLPTYVSMRNGAHAVLDLVRAARGEPDAWTVTYAERELVDIHRPDDRSVYLAGMAVDGDSLGAVISATRQLVEEERHSPAGDAATLRAGQIALGIRDAMLRARLLDHCGAWVAVLGTLIDDDPAHGRLHDPLDGQYQPDARGRGGCRLLRVVCPSTGRAYVHAVPREHATARAARLWMMAHVLGGEAPEVET